MAVTVPWSVSGQNSITLAMLETPMSTYNPTNSTELGPTTAVANSATTTPNPSFKELLIKVLNSIWY
jgi:hypothetical protein